MPIWSEAEIKSYIKTGYDKLVRATLPLWDFDYLNDVAGTAIYSVPGDSLIIDRVQWNWGRIPPATTKELRKMDPHYRVTRGQPRAYSVDQDGIGAIRLWPIPAATATEDQDVSNTRVEYYQRGSALIDDLDEFDIPRWTVKYVRFYALWKAYEREGKGQDLALAAHFKGRYETGEARLKERKRRVTLSRTGRLGGSLAPRTSTSRPQLPWQYRNR